MENSLVETVNASTQFSQGRRASARTGNRFGINLLFSDLPQFSAYLFLAVSFETL
ncbi:MAG: hypothetical protein LBI27_05180 [Clostridiales bacterium]|jgi:hypothetical protein|nr:hypothetical protein [Clostridiales bacterium]